MKSSVPKYLSSKNLKRYAHTQSFSRLAGRKTVAGKRGRIRFADRISGERLGAVLLAVLALLIATGGAFVIF